MKKNTIPFLAGVVACIFGTNQALADLTINIDDLTEGIPGVSVIGSGYVPGTLQLSPIPGYPESMHFSFLASNPTWSQTGGGMAIFAEPEDPTGPISDLLSIQWSTPINDVFYGLVSSVHGDFYSDADPSVFPRVDQLSNVRPYLETGQPVLVPLLDPDTLGGSSDGPGGPVPFSVYVTSDIPEPSTTMIAGALLLLPFGAQVVRRLRNRKPAA